MQRKNEMQYGPEHAQFYDAVFESRGKDFAGEAGKLAALIREHRPQARSLRDVACGTGAHLAAFTTLFDEVEGIEYAPAMAAVARTRLPQVPIHAGDMRDFALERTFDAVTCVGNSVGCMDDRKELSAAIARMAAHVVPGGVLVVEPWWFPSNFTDGHVGGHVLKEDGRVVSRLTRSVRDGDKTRHEVRFTVADASGIRDFSEVLVVSLFHQEDYEDAFAAAGCTAQLVGGLQLADGRPNSPGLFVAIRQ
jgi:SAM-dependent methyltransferase